MFSIHNWQAASKNMFWDLWSLYQHIQLSLICRPIIITKIYYTTFKMTHTARQLNFRQFWCSTWNIIYHNWMLDLIFPPHAVCKKDSNWLKSHIILAGHNDASELLCFLRTLSISRNTIQYSTHWHAFSHGSPYPIAHTHIRASFHAHRHFEYIPYSTSIDGWLIFFRRNGQTIWIKWIYYRW